MFGKYTGNGNVDGPFIWCGFKPRYLLVKAIDYTASWLIYDSQREIYNPVNDYLIPNNSGTEGVGNYHFDFLANGFKVRNTSDPGTNGLGNNYIFAAFAEAPFKYANAR